MREEIEGFISNSKLKESSKESSPYRQNEPANCQVKLDSQ